jgi:FkbM family methyltransferase
MKNTEKLIEHINFTRWEWKTKPEYASLIEFLSSEKIESYIDLGANTGTICRILKETIPSLKRCYLFEPQKENYDFIVSHLSDIISEDILVFDKGIYYGKDKMTLYRGDENVGGYTAIQYPGFSPSGGDADMVTLESIGVDLVDFIKIDVEGSEPNIIENSEYLNRIKYIQIEFHPPFDTEDKCKPLLKENLKNHSIVGDLSIFPGSVFLRMNEK